MLSGIKRTKVGRISVLAKANLHNRNWIKSKTAQDNMKEIMKLCGEILDEY